MRVVVDLTRCQAYAQCAFLAPDVFAIRGSEALVYDPQPGEAERERVLRAAAACPVHAIRVDQIAGREAQEATGLVFPPESAPSRRGTRARPDAATEAVRRGGRVVIVGASLAGLRAAATLRLEGFTGSLTIVGDEPHYPYDRPPLSKQVLDADIPAAHTGLPASDRLNARWLLGVAATGLDLVSKQVRLADGGTVEYDRLLIATGTRPRPWFNETEAALEGVFLLRSRDDAARLHQRLAQRPGRVLIIGGGFTGSELASVCRERDLPVTLIERGPAPLVGAFGGVIGAIAADIQREHGVDLRCEATVASLEGDGNNRLRRAHLSDGTTVDADLAMVALGAVRNVEWLYGSGLAVGDWGVGCDAGCRAFDVNGLVTDDVFVAGDVARFPHPLYEYQFLALEHWGNAVTQAHVAAHNMISAPSERWPHLTTPVFWSTQFGNNIKSVGVPTFADEVVVAQGSPERRRFVAVYGYHGRVTAAVAFNHGKWLEFYRHLIEAASPFPPSFRAVDEPTDHKPVPAHMPDRNVRDLQATVVVTGHDPSERRAELIRRG